VWVIKAVTPGSQEVRGINGRFWENITGNEESFTLNINVVSQI
jgi:inhibitor of cysteine peptidase